MTESNVREITPPSSGGSAEKGEREEQNMTKATPYEPWPLDFRLLEMMPDKGLIGNVHWKGRRVRDLADEIGREYVSSDQVAGRLRELKRYGYVEQFVGAGASSKGAIWARTEEGKALLAEKEKYLDGS